jgi:hypothetical protein
MSDEENTQSTTADTESSGVSKPEPIQPESTPENQISPSAGSGQVNPAPENLPTSPEASLNKASEPMAEAPIPPTESTPTEVPPVAPEASPNPESAIPVKDDISANEPLNQPDEPAPTSEIPPAPEPIPALETPQNSPETVSPQPTAQMAGNEPFDKTQDRPTDMAEEIKIKQRQENLKLANEKRQSKKREKIDEILNLFAERQTVTNDEVEKLLHVSDATATRYLEILENENKIKQVGKTGKGVKYQRI